MQHMFRTTVSEIDWKEVQCFLHTRFSTVFISVSGTGRNHRQPSETVVNKFLFAVFQVVRLCHQMVSDLHRVTFCSAYTVIQAHLESFGLSTVSFTREGNHPNTLVLYEPQNLFLQP